MHRGLSGHHAIQAYRDKQLDYDQLIDWAFTFDDDPARRSDEASSKLAAEVLMTHFEVQDGVRTMIEFDQYVFGLLPGITAAAD